MLSTILFIYLGIKIGADAWYFWICGILIAIQLIKLCWGMYKSGQESSI